MSAPMDPQPGYQYPQPVSSPPRNGFGIAALVLGLLAVLLSWTVFGGIVFGLLALIFGILGRGRAKRGEATTGGISIAGLVLGVIGALISIAIIALGAAFFSTPVAKDYTHCLQQANGDQAKIQQCVQEFSQRVGGSR